MKAFYFLSVFLFSLNGVITPVNGQSDRISVYVFLLEDCVISQYYTLPLRDLHEEFASDDVKFIGVFPNRFSSKKGITQFKNKYKIPFELRYDYYQGLAEKMKATVTPEVVVYNETKEEILYKGRIDNTYFRVGKRRRITTTSELKDVLTAIKNNQLILTENTTAIGCFIKWEEDN